MGMHDMVCAIGLLWPLMSERFTIPQAERWGWLGDEMEHIFKETRHGIVWKYHLARTKRDFGWRKYQLKFRGSTLSDIQVIMTLSPCITRSMLFLFNAMATVVCVGADIAKTTSSLDAEATSLTPDFTAVVVKDAGLWPQLQITNDGTLLAFGYNAPAHTTLPADVECWASDDAGSSLRLGC